MSQDPTERALEALKGYGLEVDVLDTSGTLKRCRVTDDKSGRQSGWYVIHELRVGERTRLFGAFGNWKLGEEPQTLKASMRGLGEEERKSYREKLEAAKAASAEERRRAAEGAAARAAELWPRMPEEGRSGYLDRKQVRAFGLRFARDGTIVVPVRGADDVLRGLQFIDAAGGKRFLTATAVGGGFHLIDGQPAAPALVVVAEGYATAATVHQALACTVAVAFNANNLEAVAVAMRDRFGLPILIAADDDRFTTDAKGRKTNPGLKYARRAATRVRGAIAAPAFGDGSEGTDWNDVHTEAGLGAVEAQLSGPVRELLGAPRPDPKLVVVPSEVWRGDESAEGAEDWRDVLGTTQGGKFRGDLANTWLVLANDQRWREVLAYCDFSYRILKLKRPPFAQGAVGEWSDADSARLRVWLASEYQFTPGAHDTEDAVLVCAEARRHHPVRDYLEGLEWDGEPRLEHWLADYLNARQDDYTAAVGSLWLISAVARVLRPAWAVDSHGGVKADGVLILEGKQGAGKSTALAILGGAWFADSHFDLGDKDGYQHIIGRWIVELSELDAFNKAQSTRAKGFFASNTDRFRPSYGRRAADFARQCVFGGTTNQRQYLKDPSGNRRYWPVEVGGLEADALAGARDQLFAEAVVRLGERARWWPTDEQLELFEEQSDLRYQGDAWEEKISRWLGAPENHGENEFTALDIMAGALRLDPANMKQPEQTRLGMLMSRLGWRNRKATVVEGERKRRRLVYIRPPEAGPDA